MMDNTDEHQLESGIAWIKAELAQLASAGAVQIDDADLREVAQGELLIVRAHGARATLQIATSTIEDVAIDQATQTAVRDRLRDLISSIPQLGDRAIFERADGLFDVENVVAGKRDAARAGLKSLDEAWQIARGHGTSGRVWIRHHETPTAYKPFRG
jgi:hypothetical protein